MSYARKILLSGPSLSRRAVLIVGAALLLLVGLVDYLTGREVALILFYVLPIGYVSWFAGWRLGAFFAITAMVVWLGADLLGGMPAPLAITAWNAFSRLVLFAAVAAMLGYLRRIQLEQLKHLEEKYMRIVETAIEAVVATDSEGNITFVNARASEFFGQSARSLVGVRLPKLTKDSASCAWLESLLGGNEIPREPLEVQFDRPDQRVAWAIVRATPSFDDQEKRSSTVFLFIDITERRNAEEALRQLEQRYSKAFKAGPDMLVISRVADGRILDFNEACEKFSGYRRDELVGSTSLEIHGFVRAEDRSEMVARLKELGSLRNFETDARRKSGEIRRVGISAEPIEINGESCMLSILRDITEQKRVEQQLRYQARLLENVSDAVISTDINFTIMTWNRAAESIYGWRAEEMVGKPLESLTGSGCPSGRDQLVNALHECGQWEGEVIHHGKDGKPVRILTTTTLLKDEAERPLGTVSVNRDITSRKQAEEELLRSYEEISALQRLSSVLGQSLDLDYRLKTAVEMILEVTKFDAGNIYLIDETGQKLVARYQHGFSEKFLDYVADRPIGRGVTGQVAQTGIPSFIDDVCGHPVFDQCVQEMENVHGFASLPLVAKDRILGVLNIALRRPYSFTEARKLTLQTCAKQIAAALENAQLYDAARKREEQVRRLSIDLVNVQEEERKRFARELHDGLSQVLTTLKISADLIAKNLRSDVSAAEESVRNVLLLADEAQFEAKQIAFDLRPAILDDFGLRAAISLRASKFEQLTGVAVELHLPQSDVRFDPIIETTVYRIVQELLTNVAKHSAATRVIIQMLLRGSILALTVADNGRGFDVQRWLGNEHREHCGLRNVRERVEFFGGMFRVESAHDRGAELLIEIPVKDQISTGNIAGKK